MIRRQYGEEQWNLEAIRLASELLAEGVSPRRVVGILVSEYDYDIETAHMIVQTAESILKEGRYKR